MPTTPTDRAVVSTLVAEPAHPTAFITASVSTDTSVVRDALRRRGYTPFALDEVESRGRSVPDLLRDYVAEADLVVALIDDDPSARDVFHEIGFAQACGRQILALSPDGLGSRGDGITHLWSQPTDLEAIEFGLDMILAAPERRVQGEAVTPTTPIGDLADDLLDEYRQIDPVIEKNVYLIIERAIQASGVDTPKIQRQVSLSSSNGHAGRVDFAVWSADLEPWIGNPLLVEVRRAEMKGAELDRGIEAMRRYLAASTGRFGLLITTGPEPARPSVQAGPTNVLVISVERFLTMMKTTGFAGTVQGLRNECIHGRP